MGIMHSKGFIKEKYGSLIPDVSLPNGIYCRSDRSRGTCIDTKEQEVRWHRTLFESYDVLKLE